MSQPAITVYGAYWCPDCRRAKKFLGEQFVQYNWVDIEQDGSTKQVASAVGEGAAAAISIREFLKTK